MVRLQLNITEFCALFTPDHSAWPFNSSDRVFPPPKDVQLQ